MPRDYASSSRRSGGKRGQSKRKPARNKRNSGPFLHGPSLSIGILLGAAGLALILYLPDWLARPVLATAAPDAESPQAVEFDYRDILEDAQVETTSAPETSADPTVPALGTTRIRLQAGAFRNADDADRLRASLLLLDLPVSSVVASLSDGDWHRVMVGPFDQRIDAQRAMTRLREQNLTPIWLESASD